MVRIKQLCVALLVGGCSVASVFAKSWYDKNLPKIPQWEYKETLEYPQSLKDQGVDKLVLIARKFINSTHTYTYFNEGFREGGGLYLFGEDGFTQLIDSSEGQILDAELSYDAATILFSWKKKASINYDLYTINVDGSNLKQLTQHPANDFNASWLPDGGIAFLSDRASNFAYCHDSSSAVLYRMEPDGTDLRRLSANYLSDITPHVMNDGKILYCRWEYVDRVQIPCQGLWAQNPDGTNLKHVFGGRMIDPITIMEAKSIPGTNKIIATLTGHNGAICGGIGIVDPSKGAHNPDGVTTILGDMVKMSNPVMRNKKTQYYEFPYPLNKERFLVSNNGSIEMSSYDGKSVEQIIPRHRGPAKGKIGFYAALPVKSRVKEPIVQSALPNDTAKNGTLIMQDVYMGLEEELKSGLIKQGEIKEIRIVQGLGKSNKGSKRPGSAFCWQFPVVSAGATMEPKKTVTVVDVESDGSMMCEVPSMVPLLFQALDADGRVIHRMRTFTQLMPGEVQSCTGCHSDRNRAVPVNDGKRIKALTKPVVEMTGAKWNEHESAFSYAHQIQPIWDKHCTKCHNARQQPGELDLSGDYTDLFNVSYDNLVRTDVTRDPSKRYAKGDKFKHKYVSFIPSYNGTEYKYMSQHYFEPKSWGAMQSKLAELISSGHKDDNGEPRANLSDQEKRTVYAWIDYNVPYYPTSHPNHPDLPHGMRKLVPKGFDKLLLDVAERRCISCHTTQNKEIGWWAWDIPKYWPRDKKKEAAAKARYKLPRKFYLRWEKPELNNFMLAPLAKSAGGLEKCGSVFKDKGDKDYQKLLKAFKPIHKRVNKIPRMDMPGAKEVRGKRHTQLYQCQDQP